MNQPSQGPFSTFEQATASEYVTTSGSGAYSSSTACGADTRRYHALLATPLAEPPGVFVMLSALEEVIDIAGAQCYMSTHEYPGAIFPQGYKHIQSFHMSPLPTFHCGVHGVEIVKKIAMCPDEATVVVSYELVTKRPDVLIEIRPLCTARDRHALTEANVAANLSATTQGEWVVFRPYAALPALKMRFPGEYKGHADWYRRIQYRRDKERGYPWQEDLVSPGAFKAQMEPGQPVYFTATMEKNTPDAKAIVEAAEARAFEWTKPARRFSPLAKGLAEGFRDFFVQRGNETGILRGLLWYGEWSRNALMALPGLLALGRYVEAEGVLATWARRAKDGVLPRYIDDYRAAGPGDLEATLWFFEAVENLLSYTKNYDWVKANVLPFMAAAVEAVMTGKAGARIGEEGLLYTSGAGRALAPRIENAAFVEIQALYFNALKVMEGIYSHFRDEKNARNFEQAAKGPQRAFNKLMWDAYNHVPVDAYAESGMDRTPRPMALFAVSLSHPVLIRRRWEILVDQIESALLTARGLLAVPKDYLGSRQCFPGTEHEQAHRYGGIWTQFLGAFLVAHAKTFGQGSSSHNERFLEYLRPLEEQLSHGMVNHVGEFFDSVEPFTQRGAPADAAAAGQLIWALTTKVEARQYEVETES